MNRDEPPGLRLVPGGKPPQIVSHTIESGVMHSRSLGWMPAVIIEMTNDDGHTTAGAMLADDALDLVEKLLTAVERSEQDYTAAVMDGYKKD